jgi:ribosomal protein S18 acetylase RimI-like enzyme
MELRRVLASDYEAFISLRHEMLAAHPTAFLESLDESRARARESVEESLGRTPDDHPESQVLGAFEGRELVAALGFYRFRSAKQRHLAEIWGVYTRPAFRRRGLNRALMLMALDALRGQGVRQAMLSTVAGNTSARALYRSLGFVSYGVTPNFLLVDGVFHDEELMALDLAR